jgi:hypothetical protein
MLPSHKLIVIKLRHAWIIHVKAYAKIILVPNFKILIGLYSCDVTCPLVPSFN